MASPSLPAPTPAPLSPGFPLEPGDHLTREEFERRYDAMPELKKAELIEGVVHMPSPVRWSRHASPHIHVATWLGTYEAATPGTQAGDNGSIRLDIANEPQPDVALIILPSHGGRARISTDDYIVGGPELIVEVAASSASIDLNTKFRVYERHGVQEYVVWSVLQQQIDWFVLRGGHFDRLPVDPAGHYHSEVFPGLWLDPAALARRDLATVVTALQQGLASPEHAAFVADLQRRGAFRKSVHGDEHRSSVGA